MTDKISPLASIDPSAKIAPGVEVGPWSFIGANVEIGAGTVVGPHVVIKGTTKIGKDNRFFQFCSIGEDTQDLKYAGEETYLDIGDGNVFREYVSVHRGTAQDKSLTRIGSHNAFLTYSHVAHDCDIGNHIILGHNAGLAGHVKISDHAILSAFAGVHQFAHVGAHCFIARATMLVKDLPPYMMAAGGDAARAVSINSEGLKRRGFTSNDLLVLKRAYKAVYREGLTIEQALEKLTLLARDSSAVQAIIDFIEQSTRGILR
jgi:UDP-N-acetylglucosamine acyltransferase